MIHGIDVSELNGHLEEDFWQRAVDAGCKFVFVRCSYGNGHEDGEFRHNVAMAHRYGLKVGAYHYDYSLTERGAAQAAQKCAQIIADSGVLLELPVFYDLEDADHWKEEHGYDFSGATATAQVRAWMDNLGLNTGVYASYGWLMEKVADSQGNSGDGQPIDWRGLGCAVWNAEWNQTDDLQGYVWQYSDSHPVLGCDADVMYAEELFK
ncbi:GH25 family lysozyme [Acidaminococcus fermentans]|uniref:GH25 family lysozyme n=1 Tax=Acidaminococcus fermentans TaxID=905 RepID=UPI003F8A71E2